MGNFDEHNWGISVSGVSVADPHLRRALTSLWEAAEGQVEEMRTRLEVWFNDAMDRVSGWYRRHVQMILAVIAIVVVGTLNADTVRIASVLWTNPTVRAAGGRGS